MLELKFAGSRVRSQPTKYIDHRLWHWPYRVNVVDGWPNIKITLGQCIVISELVMSALNNVEHKLLAKSLNKNTMP